MMDDPPALCYTGPMSGSIEKRDGFKGERMIVLPTEAFRDYVEHPLVRRLYLTDVGFFPVRKTIIESERMASKSTFSFIVQRGKA